jgi:hypothetical protein
MLNSRHNAHIGIFILLTAIDYNEHKAGMNFLGQRSSHGTPEHKTVKEKKELAFPYRTFAIYNACILYNAKKLRNLVQVHLMFSVDDNPNWSATTTFLSLTGRRKPREDAMYAQIWKKTSNSSMVGKTNPTSVPTTMLLLQNISHGATL